MKKLIVLIVAMFLLCLTTQAWAAPAAPTTTYETNGLNITVSWTEVPYATSYTLYYAEYPYEEGDYIGSMDQGTETTFSIDLWDGAAYYIAVTASDAAGESPYSNIELFLLGPNSTSNLPDTGQTSCYDTTGNIISCAGTGQNGEYTRNPMSYTDNGNDTVTDNVTGLIWQQTDDDQRRTWEDAMSYCSSYSPDNSSWRLPSISELQTIVDAGTYDPAINAVFAGTNASYYWSSTSNALWPTTAWLVDFVSGRAGSYFDKTESYYVRCVR